MYLMCVFFQFFVSVHRLFIMIADTDVLLMGPAYFFVVVGSVGSLYCPINTMLRLLRI
jgi:hypothetical protein